MLLLREGIEMFSNMFCIRGEGSVYINIRGDWSVIQVSLRGSVIYSIIKYIKNPKNILLQKKILKIF